MLFEDRGIVSKEAPRKGCWRGALVLNMNHNISVLFIPLKNIGKILLRKKLD